MITFRYRYAVLIVIGLVLIAAFSIFVMPSIAQGTSYTEIPSGWNNNTYDLPLDMCYSIVDQHPMLTTTTLASGTYIISYINTDGNSIMLVYSYDAMNSHYWLSSKYIGKAAIQAKCYQLPTAAKAK